MNMRILDTRYSYPLGEALLDYERRIYDLKKSVLGHYFSTIYHIIKFIDTSNIENKMDYISILRSQLSNYEQALIFYNCLHFNGKEKFKPLIEKYTIFENIDKTLIHKDHLKEYKPSAYFYNASEIIS